ncbi:MAG: ribose 5-phosphate isomerase A [Planctomycetota bacterium]|nr:MAG: ribose 5-phosphate isomerase A [Planctomycetota bacterium]
MVDSPSPKQAAGIAAAEHVKTGMILGLGTGSTVAFFLDALAERMAKEGIEVIGVPTSVDTADKCKELGISLATLEEQPVLDLVIDGADEVDPEFRLVKGGGGALLREKIVAAAGTKVIIIIGSGKRVDRLGTTFLLPVEVLPFGYLSIRENVAQLGCCKPYVRNTEAGEPFITDNGNYILDCQFENGIADANQLHADLSQIPGVVEVGLFINLCHLVIEGADDGKVVTLQR